VKPVRLQALVSQLIESGLLISSGAIRTEKVSSKEVQIEIGDTSAIEDLNPTEENSISHFSKIVGQGRYSAMFRDGAVCQIKYVLKGKEIVWHRFAYFPCLREMDQSLLADDAELAALVDGDVTFYPRRSMLRFEYDPDAATDSHPASHLHINTNTCRIGIKSSIGLGAFFDFLISHFYADQNFQLSAEFLPDFGAKVALSETQQEKIHLSWSTPA
jgi:hypothetical protein